MFGPFSCCDDGSEPTAAKTPKANGNLREEGEPTAPRNGAIAVHLMRG